MLCTVCSPVRSGRGTCLRMNPAKRAVLLKIKCFKILICNTCYNFCNNSENNIKLAKVNEEAKFNYIILK